jgi:uncharacterized protein (UPF0332 family)
VNRPGDLLEKAARSIDAAETLLGVGHLDFAASRAYYACFYIAQALLASRNLEFSSHGQVLAQYGRYFSKTRALDPTYHTLLANAFDLRHIADYQTGALITLEVVSEMLAGGRRFLTAARNYLESFAEGGGPGDS